MGKRFKQVTAAVVMALLVLSLLIPGTLALVDGDEQEAPEAVIAPEGESDLAAEPMEQATRPQSITVTFVIDNPDYTRDPGNGQTHLTTRAPIEGGELTYTAWAGRYKVEGTGTVCQYVIPAGTSLRDNGLSTPAFEVENIAQPQITYDSVYAWRMGNLPCTADTVFTENARLALTLFGQADTQYTIDFVCCAEHNQSIGYFVPGVGTPPFLLGDCISADYIPTRDMILPVAESYRQNARYEWERVWAEHPYEDLVGWQLVVTDTGESVALTPDTPITQAYVDPQWGETIKAYPIFERLLTVTFMNGENVVETRTVPQGEAVGTLPEQTPPEGMIFLGWRQRDTEQGFATAQTVITQDMIFDAVFGPVGQCRVAIYDVQPLTTPTEPDQILSLPAGTPLSQLAAEPFADGERLNRCIWYTFADGVKTPVDFATYVVEQDIELYTYTYRLTLTLTPAQTRAAISTMALVEVETGANGSLTMTITAREGQSLSPQDFVVNGVDYSLYSWSYTDAGGVTRVLNLSDLIANGLTQDIQATSTGTLPARLTPVTNEIRFYVFEDDQRRLLSTQTVTSYQISGKGNRRYLSAATLAAVYAPYGFTADMMTAGTRYFPHTDKDRPNIWGDTQVELVDGNAFSPIITSGNTAEVYYLPRQTVTNQNSWAGILAAKNDTFYSIRVVDDNHFAYAPGQLPQIMYVQRGGVGTYTVSTTSLAGETFTWKCQGADEITVIPGVDNGNGTMTFTVTNIDQPYVITADYPDTICKIVYRINLPPVTPMDTEYGRPTIMGGDTYTVLARDTEAEHILLEPSMTLYHYTVSPKYMGEALFQGWRIVGVEGNVRNSGTALDLEPYRGETVVLEGQWLTQHASNQTSTKTGSMVNYFVSLNAHPVGNSAWSGSIEQTTFTNSVYADDCGVRGDVVVSQHLYTSTAGTGNYRQYYVLGGTSGTDVNQNHQQIVEKLTNGYTLQGEQDGLDYTFHVSFPSDESVLRRVRQMMTRTNNPAVIRVNGQVIPPEHMNTAHFSVRWYVFKYDVSDGWHIDGVLVSKDGLMCVTKTFAGDTASVAAVKENYSITVAGESGTAHTGGELYLHTADDYDQSTDTYTWYVPVDHYYRYTFTENNHIIDNPNIECLSSYEVADSDTNQNTTAWQTYTNGITLSGEGHEDAERSLTLRFLNTYNRKSDIVLRKVDEFSGSVMAGVEFTLSNTPDGQPLTLYLQSGQQELLGDGHRYTLSPTGNAEVAMTGFATGPDGQAYLALEVGTYYLREVVPDGYEDPGPIRLTVAALDGSYRIESAEAVNYTGEAPDPYVQVFGEAQILTVRNHANKLTLKVVKTWADNTPPRPITIQLLCGGNPVGSPVVLDGTVGGGETAPWVYQFTDLPRYMDNAPANYSILETAIGDMLYSAEFSDGYRYYQVTYSPITFYDHNDQPVRVRNAPIAHCQYAVLGVTNKLNTYSLYMDKVDTYGQPLGGARFALYAGQEQALTAPPPDLTGLTPIAYATSDNVVGRVFFDAMPEGVYYAVETAAPDGYVQAGTIYRLQSGSGLMLVDKWVDGAWRPTINNQVINNRAATDVTISKLVGGRLGNKFLSFEFTVTSSLPMGAGEGYSLSSNGRVATFSLSHQDSVVLRDVPLGAALTVTETNAGGYWQTYRLDGTTPTGVDGQPNCTVNVTRNMELTVRNIKDGIPDEGILLDKWPYVLILAGAVAGVVYLILRKRRKREDE